MTYPFESTTLVKEIVNVFPKSADLFKRNRIDFCCGGGISLEQAAAEREVAIDGLMEELHQLYDQYAHSADDLAVWTNSDSTTIIEHIKDHYHRPLEEELTNLSPYVTKVAKVHGGHRPELLRVYELFYELKKELLEHTEKEEASVFPLLQKLTDENVDNREEILDDIRELEKEHDHAGAILKELRDITSDFQPPLDACGTYRLVYKRLEMLEEQTFMHVHLENNILFPRYLEA